MARFRLYEAPKGKDYKYIDGIVEEFIHASSTSILIHKYLGPKEQGELNDLTQPNIIATEDGFSNETDIQDLLFLENRDRKYDKTIYDLAGVYQVADPDFTLEQFGLFLGGDVINVFVHYNNMISQIGRKLMPGDVLELPHMRDVDLLDEDSDPINRFYQITDGTRTAEGYSPTWNFHMFRLRAEPLTDSPEFKDLLGDGSNVDDLRNKLSTYSKELNIMDQILAQGDAEVPKTGFDTTHLYYFDEEANAVLQRPSANWAGLMPYDGDGIPPNGLPLSGSGTVFPQSPDTGDYFLRTDYLPNVLYRRDEGKWTRFETVFRREWTAAHKTAETFINNDATTELEDGTDPIPQKQPLAKVVKPRED